MQAIAFLSVAALAETKSLDPAWLRREFGLADARYAGQRAVRIPYRAADGSHLFDKIRLAEGTQRYVPTGVRPTLYGIDRLDQAADDAVGLLVEGESDVWASVTHGASAVGIPGANGWRSEFAALLTGRNVVLWEEPDAAGAKLVVSVARDLPNARVIGGDSSAKDPCELHQLVGDVFPSALAAKIDRAVPIGARVAMIRRHEPAVRPVRPPSPRYPTHPARDDGSVERAKGRSLVDVMQAAGVEFRSRSATSARCPFHEDRHASLSVSEKRGLWKCHGCDAAGDVITFVMKAHGLDFRSAVRELVR